MNWDQIYDECAPSLFSYLLSRGASRDMAEEVIQEVFSSAIAAKAKPQNIRAYMFSSSRRSFAKLNQKPKLNKTELVDIVEEEKSGIDSEAINMKLAELPVEQREVVVLKIWHSMTFAEIAEALGESPNTVAGRWRYAAGKLKVLLQGSHK